MIAALSVCGFLWLAAADGVVDDSSVKLGDSLGVKTLGSVNQLTDPLPLPEPTVVTGTAEPAHADAEGAKLHARGNQRPRDLFMSRLAVVLAGLIAVLVAALIWRKRRQAKELDEIDIHVLATRMLSPKSQVSVLEIDGHRLVVGLTPQGMQLLGSLGERSSARPQTFGSLLEHAERHSMEPASVETEGIVRLREAKQRKRFEGQGAL